MIICGLFACRNHPHQQEDQYGGLELPDSTPIALPLPLPQGNHMIHKGVFSPDLQNFYFTQSDPDFTNFDVYVIQQTDDGWGTVEPAFFNSEYDEHGMSFSPDGQTIFFASTRPADSLPKTWHLWTANREGTEWSKPTLINIPNLHHKLLSHPSMAADGSLYFHASNLDYSEMDLYVAEPIAEGYGATEKVFSEKAPIGRCTPFISPDERYLLYAEIGNELDLMLSTKDEKGNWTMTRRLSASVNTHGQGNPSVSPDGKFLLYTTGKEDGTNWQLQWGKMPQ
ncbi:MAG: hypothetical protein AAF206_01735 [Bacteroidota bacterium]